MHVSVGLCVHIGWLTVWACSERERERVCVYTGAPDLNATVLGDLGSNYFCFLHPCFIL